MPRRVNDTWDDTCEAWMQLYEVGSPVSTGHCPVLQQKTAETGIDPTNIAP